MDPVPLGWGKLHMQLSTWASSEDAKKPVPVLAKKAVDAKLCGECLQVLASLLEKGS